MELLGAYHQPDPYLLLPWDISHWMDIVMVQIHEDLDSAEFLIKRSNKMHTMFQRGKSHVEYIGLAKHLNLKALETVIGSMKKEEWND